MLRFDRDVPTGGVHIVQSFVDPTMGDGVAAVLLVGSGEVATETAHRLKAVGCVVLREVPPADRSVPTVAAIYCCVDSDAAMQSGSTLSDLRRAAADARRFFRGLYPLVVLQGHVVVGTTDWLQHVFEHSASVAYLATHTDARHGGPVIGADQPEVARRVATLEPGNGTHTHLSRRAAEMVDCARRVFAAVDHQVLGEVARISFNGHARIGHTQSLSGSHILRSSITAKSNGDVVPSAPADRSTAPPVLASLAELAKVDTPILSTLASHDGHPDLPLPHVAIGRAYLAGLDEGLVDAAGPAGRHIGSVPRWYPVAKRTIDLLVAAPALVVASPLMLGIAAMVVIESGWPIFFSHSRMGRDGKPFQMLKFRSMRASAPPTANKTDAEVHATRVGRVLRATALDELPQLINVLKGDMSLVGPRPEQPFIADWYQPWQRERHQVRPGLTGWWQIHLRGKEREMYRHVHFDVWYVRNRSLMLDLRILLKTPCALYSAMAAALFGRRSG